MTEPVSRSSPGQTLLFDTNVLIISVRAGEASRRLRELLGLESASIQGLISVVSVGEAKAFAKKLGWGQRRLTALEGMMDKLIPVDINTPEVIEAYAEIDHYSEKLTKPARPMGQNDMWIAATAHVLQLELVTTDKDFDHLHGTRLTRRWIDPSSLRAQGG